MSDREFIRVLNEETVLAGYPGGDRAQTLKNVRAMRVEIESCKASIAKAYRDGERAGYINGRMSRTSAEAE